MTDEFVLSQADIDSMVAKSSRENPDDDSAAAGPVKVQKVADSLSNIKSIPARREAPATETAAAIPASKPTVSPAAQKPTAPQPRQDLALKTSASSASTSEVETLRRTVAELTNRLNKLETVMFKSQKSFRCDIRNNFHCGHCQSEGKVAMYLKCTSCGEEQWVGWWPNR
jgi:hypothetical protein